MAEGVTDDQRITRPDEIWDRFVDALDQAGREGLAAAVTVPEQIQSAVAGKRFGDLTRLELRILARIGSDLGRRGETVVTLWEDMQRRAAGKHKLTRRKK